MNKELHETMGWRGPVTHRQFIAWCLWMEYDWERPTYVTKHLQMVAAEIRRSWVKNPWEVQLEDMKLTMVEAVDADGEIVEVDGAIARWGGPIRHIVYDTDGNVVSERMIDGRTGIGALSRSITRREFELHEDLRGCEEAD